MPKKKLSSRVKRKIAEWYADRERNAADAELQEAVDKRTKCRLRLWECIEPTCAKKLRVADDHLRAYHEHIDLDTGDSSFLPFVLRTPVLTSAVPF